VTQQVVDPATDEIQTATVVARSLLTTEGIRFIYTSVIPNFMSFTAVGLIIVAMIGVGVAESSGLIQALIRQLVAVSPGWAIAYILVFIGIVSSIAADAGYLVLIPLAGTAFLSVGRHPLAGLAAGFAAVAAAFEGGDRPRPGNRGFSGSPHDINDTDIEWIIIEVAHHQDLGLGILFEYDLFDMTTAHGCGGIACGR
jgi:hypothetical protein